MGIVNTTFTMSLDGFIAEPDNEVMRLFKWYFNGDTAFPLPGTSHVFKMSAVSAALFGSYFVDTGALVTGRGDFEASNAWNGSPPFNVPTFIVTHQPPQEWLKPDSPFTFVTEGVERAIELAKQAAGDKNVLVSGSKIVQQGIRAGLIDEINIDLASMLLGKGISLFGTLGIEPLELERVHVIEGTDVTHIRYRIRK